MSNQEEGALKTDSIPSARIWDKIVCPGCGREINFNYFPELISQERLADELEKFIERLPTPWWQKTIFYGREIVKLLREGTIPAPQSGSRPHLSED